jgi:hypothetical protein
MDWDASKQAIINAQAQRIEQLEQAIEDLLPPAMCFFSEHYWAAGWLVSLETELPKIEPMIHKAAQLIGKIPTTYNPEGERDWQIYQKLPTKNDAE